MRPRKTIEIEAVKLSINGMLARSADDHAQGRVALAVFLEHLLMDTGNYKGFRHPGHPGPHTYRDDGTWLDANGVPIDDTRRIYI